MYFSMAKIRKPSKEFEYYFILYPKQFYFHRFKSNIFILYTLKNHLIWKKIKIQSFFVAIKIINLILVDVFRLHLELLLGKLSTGMPMMMVVMTVMVTTSAEKMKIVFVFFQRWIIDSLQYKNICLAKYRPFKTFSNYLNGKCYSAFVKS